MFLIVITGSSSVSFSFSLSFFLTFFLSPLQSVSLSFPLSPFFSQSFYPFNSLSLSPSFFPFLSIFPYFHLSFTVSVSFSPSSVQLFLSPFLCLSLSLSPLLSVSPLTHSQHQGLHKWTNHIRRNRAANLIVYHSFPSTLIALNFWKNFCRIFHLKSRPAFVRRRRRR